MLYLRFFSPDLLLVRSAGGVSSFIAIDPFSTTEEGFRILSRLGRLNSSDWVEITADHRDHHDKIRTSTSDLGNSSMPLINIAINIVVNFANIINFKTFYVR